MSTIDGSNHIDINQRLPKFEGFDETATDFAEQIDRAIEQYNDVLNYAKEVTDEKIKLEKENQEMREALKWALNTLPHASINKDDYTKVIDLQNKFNLSETPNSSKEGV